MVKSFKRGETYIYQDGDGYSSEILFVGKDTNDNYWFYYAEDDYLGSWSPDYGTFEKTNKKPKKVVFKEVEGFAFAVIKLGRTQRLFAGCRVFNNISEARHHWSNGEDGEHWSDDFQGVNYEDNERQLKNNRRLKAMEKLYAKFKETK